MSMPVFDMPHFTIAACALVGGLVLAVSDAVLKGLGWAITDRAMLGWGVLALLLGVVAVSPFVLLYTMLDLYGGPGALILCGGLAYLVGGIVVAWVFHTPPPPLCEDAGAVEMTP